jgi:DNA repair exonuclease SbcCD ATPase subunit
MIRLPLFTFLRVSNYGLFPGVPSGSGLEWIFKDGLSLIAGVNGLGKTTLITILLRCLTGPCDLTGTGIPDQLESVLPAAPVSLRPAVKKFFRQRVADDAKTATAELRATFGADEVQITRNLSDMSLANFVVNGQDQELPSYGPSAERIFQEKMCGLFGLGSFIDILLILHHIVFFTEDRSGALWDENAQRQILRALFLDMKLANLVAELEREVGSADSNARNLSATAFGLHSRLQAAKDREKSSPGAAADLAVEQKLLDAELEERERLSGRLSDLDAERRDLRRQLEHAKSERERAENKVEELKFAVLARLFPKMEDSARLVVLKALSSGECLVCGADARGRRDELERLLARGFCPACGAGSARTRRTALRGRKASSQLSSEGS